MSGAPLLRVAMLSSISWRTPPRGYGPWELVTSLLTEALVARGVDVTLFATADSLTDGHLAALVPAGYSEDPTIDAKVWEMQHIAHLFERAGEFDIIHNHADFVPLAFSRLVDTPMVTTIHGFSSPRILSIYRRYDDRVAYVAISDADRCPDLDYAATIHHGIDIADFPFDPAGSDDLLFFGRSHPDKGAADAVRAAQATGRRLVMAGIVQDEGYHAREIAPHIDGDRIIHIGVVGGADRARTLGHARALLHLIGFDEPFGLSVVEAMACGTPVIAYRRGSMPELIDDGVTGFLVDSFDEAVAAIGRIGEIDRAACRSAAAVRFGVDRMADQYLALYRSILDGRRAAARFDAPALPVSRTVGPPPSCATGLGANSGSVIDCEGSPTDFAVAFSWMDKGLVGAILGGGAAPDQQRLYDLYCKSHFSSFEQTFNPSLRARVVAA
jgi:glycosyltransferase involved in cell wall biosynthesis